MGFSYGVGAIVGPGEMDHAIDAGEGGSGAAVSVWVEFLLGENIAAGLNREAARQAVSCRKFGW